MKLEELDNPWFGRLCISDNAYASMLQQNANISAYVSFKG